MRSTKQSGTWRMLAAMGGVAVGVMLLDLIVKRLVTAALGPDAEDHALWLIGEAVGLEYVRNSGAAFGIFRGNAELLAAVSVIVAIGFVWLLLVELGPGRWTVLSGGLIVGGGIGNLVERFRHGYVTDFFALGPWPRFNIADSAITIAIVIFAGALLLDGEANDEPAGERIGREGRRGGRQT